VRLVLVLVRQSCIRLWLSEGGSIWAIRSVNTANHLQIQIKLRYFFLAKILVLARKRQRRKLYINSSFLMTRAAYAIWILEALKLFAIAHFCNVAIGAIFGIQCSFKPTLV
jgi:hypothetical protein